MNNYLFNLKNLIAVIALTSLSITISYAQNNGIVPLTGLKYFNEGLVAKTIDVKIDGAQLLSNRIPLNKEIEISFHKLTGFIASANKTMYAGAEIMVLGPRGELLLKDPNLLLRSFANGFYEKELNTFSVKFGIGAELMKGNFNGIIKIRLFDMKGVNQLKMEFPVTFARAGEPLQISTKTKAIKTSGDANGMLSGLSAKGMKIEIDTSIKVSPKMAYTSVDISNIEGSSLSEIFRGKENFWVYDNNLMEIKITDILLKQVKGALENNSVNYTLKIPYCLKSNTAKAYTVRYRWESPDKSQLIDVVVSN